MGGPWLDLKPRAINKNVRGLPDEYDNTLIDVYNKTRPNWTLSGSEKLNLEVFSASKQKQASSAGRNLQSGSGFGALNLSKFVRFNNYQGVAKTSSIGLSNGFGSLSMNRSVTGITFSANINPLFIFDKNRKLGGELEQVNTQKGLLRFDKNALKFDKASTLNTAQNTVLGTLSPFRTFTDQGVTTSLSKLRGYNFNVSFGAQVNAAVAPIGIEGGLTGTFALTVTEEKESIPTFGYLNTPSGIGNYRSDYFTEKAQSFDRRDYFIGIPFSTPDNYMLTGEGLSGGFRPYRSSIGHYFPEKIDGDDNKRRTYGIGIEGMIGTNVGVGVNLAFGNTKSLIKDWAREGNTNTNSFSFDTADDQVYRFYGDMGGKMEYGNNDLAKANLTASPNFPGITTVFPTLSSDAISDLNETEAKNASYIQKETSGFSIYNEAGLKYTYDVDMMVKNTASLSIDVDENDDIEENYLAFKQLYLDNNFDMDQCEHKVVVGDVKKEGYAATSLLSSITTSDYVDLGPGGPDEEDFGGWTKFEYHKKYGDNSESGKWYRWRIPYNGLFYSKNSISDVKDDTGFVTTGEKEIYFLKKVETKTHVAYFVTNKSTPNRFDINPSDEQAKFLQGTNVDRYDGLAATDLNGSEDPSANSAASKNNIDQLEYLEKVVLFAKDRPEVPLQTTNFKYDYSLVGNLPNNSNGNFPGNTTSAESGKLTLKKVWSEFEGVIGARISSYKFDYRYKERADYPDYLVTEHPELDSFFALSDLYSVNAQNPDYGPHLLDAWGANQFNGRERHLNLIKWPYQGDIPENSFDPAAWQLKQVTLPSGGQILVEYESKDYSYVQDRNVMALVKLSQADDNYNAPTYTLDLTDIGYNSVEDADKIEDLHQYLRTYFLEEFDETSIPVNGGLANILGKDLGNLKVDKRIYFKLLYALEGAFADIENCRSEYITGYAKVLDVTYDSNNNTIAIQLDGSSDGENLVGVGLFDDPVPDQGYRLTPRQACYDFYTTQRWGKYTAGCEAQLESRYERRINELAGCEGPLVDNIGDAVAIAEFTVAGIGVVSGLSVNSRYPEKSEVCMALNPELSYLKIPINKAKRGDGIRVKRVLMFDKGIEDGDAGIYGQEYTYELEDGRSSGIATNEPNEMREENALVGFLPKDDQSWLNRLVSGKDMEQSEGPIGESLLPSPSVKHARVVVENIHKGKTGSGHTVYEFYTCRDYPFDKVYDYSQNGTNNNQYDIGTAKAVRGVDYSVLQDDSYDDKLRIPTPVFSYSVDKAWASQGFRFVMNSMDGKPKSVRTYGGDYATGNNSFISSGQDFYYYEPGEKVPMMQGDGTYYWDTPGKEMDITMEKFQLENQNLDFNFEIDVSVGLVFPPPIFVSGWLQFSFSEQKLSKYAISKVIKYPAIQKKVVSYSDNIASETEHLAFDNATGRPLLTRTFDAYHNIPLTGSTDVHDGAIYSLNLPAHWNYAQMGRKSENSNYTNQLLASSGQVVTYGSGANPLNSSNGETGTWNIKTDRVISSGANTFNTLAGVTTWIDANINAIYNSSGATTQLENIWRLHQSFVYKDDTQKSSNRNAALGKIYEGGILDDYVTFDYTPGASQDERWVKLSEVTKYSPNGNALEEQDVLGVYSASKFGYNFTQPVMIGQNARYGEIYFEHFEDKQGSSISNIVQGVGHSGNYSQEITSGSSIISNVIAQELLSTTGGWLKFWTKSQDELDTPVITVSGTDYNPELVAKTGEWTLYRVFIDAVSLPQGQQVNMTLAFNNANAYIDDIKFNPKESQTTCFVYDIKSLRLITLFDDQHFGLYYQYNNEGQLVRKLIETERGLKTITETQYNTPRENRNSL
ncbi:hypothetical protein [Flagellimonas sp. CMM7]|uniref:hypothetical protein n=1 Tax=Flagellimonas sp. CMM7 TaxID=2654676 RepID=UPI001F1890E2|nr:hypothetical protein [Flagellimonas sp. CMM7]UII80110.1 hypothetical protein LV704_00980 [Flagellimonas sp. CMM7]